LLGVIAVWILLLTQTESVPSLNGVWVGEYLVASPAGASCLTVLIIEIGWQTRVAARIWMQSMMGRRKNSADIVADTRILQIKEILDFAGI